MTLPTRNRTALRTAFRQTSAFSVLSTGDLVRFGTELFVPNSACSGLRLGCEFVTLEQRADVRITILERHSFSFSKSRQAGASSHQPAAKEVVTDPWPLGT